MSQQGGVDEDRKPDGDHINLKVKVQDGNEVFFRIKRSTQLKKLMNAYCDRQSVDIASIAFLFDGRRLRAEQTPDELEMEDGDEIDAMLHQTGGTASSPAVTDLCYISCFLFAGTLVFTFSLCL
ncbi:hypothetical protein DCAR_0522042 [Daucus carota subsp. sativus]|uniref:Small ubiquitin-related modifier n=1 Tax=Daucus carota subsp. sativus TaxID=79200 RepID=A0A164ZJM4_DAUCS|nr:PREDICTED: small ubiquitin-related modifier 1-like [Daucus carota subsp. sativus]WOH02653.1 hypothetical protein DCAR_0522042 [Daucus carota subsp. sativus]